MVKVLQSKANGKSSRIAIVVSRFNKHITQRLLDGCLAELKKLKVLEKNITVAWVPGAFELPVTSLHFAKKKNIDAVICLGCVIRGDTYHFEIVADSAAEGILQVSLKTEKPVILGVLTTENLRQAQKRSEANGDNKGREAAQSALEMISLLSQIKK